MPVQIDQLKRAANIYKVRRYLCDYFVKKVGKENINKIIMPGEIVDITEEIPQLASRVEVVASAVDLKLQEDVISIEWNMFVFGNKRIYLGKTTHIGIADTIRAIKSRSVKGGIGGVEYGTTPKRIVQFIIRVLNSSKEGYTPWVDNRNKAENILKTTQASFGYNHKSTGSFNV
jgi:hypothetical protein